MPKKFLKILLSEQETEFCMQNVFSKNVCLSTKISLRLKKKTHNLIWGQ